MPFVGNLVGGALYASGAALGVCVAIYGDDLPGRTAAAMGAGAVILSVIPFFVAWQNRCMRKADECVAVGLKQETDKFLRELARINEEHDKRLESAHEEHARQLENISKEMGRCIVKLEFAEDKLRRMTDRPRGKGGKIVPAHEVTEGVALIPLVGVVNGPVTDAVSRTEVPPEHPRS